MQNRFRSKITWISTVGLLILIFSQLGLFKTLGITSDSFKIICDSIIGILVLFGILNNPTKDDEF